jgi:flagellin
MTRINTNVSSLNAQKTLARSNNQLQEAMTRLSTGLRINSGKDDPAGLIASEMLRSDIVSTQRAVSNSERANQMIATADSALGQVSTLLTDIRGLITEAANTGGMSPDQIAANQLQIDAALESLNRISQVTSFQGRKLLDGTLDFIVSGIAPTDNVADLQIAQANLGTSGTMAVDVTVRSAATQAAITFDVAAGSDGEQATGLLDVDDGIEFTATAAYAGTEGDKVRVKIVHSDDLVADAIVSYYEYDAENDEHFAVVMLSTDGASTYTFGDVAGAIAAVEDSAGNKLVTAVAGDAGAAYDATGASPDVVELADGEDPSDFALEGAVVFELTGSKGSQVFNFGEGTTREVIKAAINAVSDATGVTADFEDATITLSSAGYGSKALVAVKTISDPDSAFSPSSERQVGEDIQALVNGILASGDGKSFSINTATLSMSATFGEGDQEGFSFNIDGGGALFQLGPQVVSNQQSRMGIVSVNTANLGGAAGRLYELGSGQDAELAKDTTRAAEIIDEVIVKVTSLRGRLGAFQKTTLESNIASLNDTLENLVAAESAIRDADFAAEAAQLTRAQILVQSGVTVLSIANANPQNVLALLR